MERKVGQDRSWIANWIHIRTQLVLNLKFHLSEFLILCVVFQQIEIDQIQGPSHSCVKFQSYSNESLPIFRLYGITSDQHSVTCHVHGFLPYFFVPCPASMNEDDLFDFKEKLQVILHEICFLHFHLLLRREWKKMMEARARYLELKLSKRQICTVLCRRLFSNATLKSLVPLQTPWTMPKVKSTFFGIFLKVLCRNCRKRF